jgi:acylphosphatase
MKSYKFIISGKVQGVYYRKYIQENSIKAGFVGYVKNLANGNVMACVTCEESQLDSFIAILKNGSPNSVVDNIKQSGLCDIFKGSFEIRY